MWSVWRLDWREGVVLSHRTGADGGAAVWAVGRRSRSWMVDLPRAARDCKPAVDLSQALGPTNWQVLASWASVLVPDKKIWVGK